MVPPAPALDAALHRTDEHPVAHLRLLIERVERDRALQLRELLQAEREIGERLGLGEVVPFVVVGLQTELRHGHGAARDRLVEDAFEKRVGLGGLRRDLLGRERARADDGDEEQRAQRRQESMRGKLHTGTGSMRARAHFGKPHEANGRDAAAHGTWLGPVEAAPAQCRQASRESWTKVCNTSKRTSP